MLIAAATLAARRWGPAIGGWIVGLPLTSAPVALFLALEHGTHFAAGAATGTLAGAISEVCFCLAWARLAARLQWPAALALALLAFLACTAALRFVTLAALPLFLAVVVVLSLGLLLMPHAERESGPPEPPRWDLPMRMVIATAFVLILTDVAPLLGPRLSGLLTPLPLYGSIQGAFTQQLEGAAAVAAFMRGLVLGLFAFATFFLVVARTIVPWSTGWAFVAAIAAALAVQGTTLFVSKQRATASEDQ